LHIRVQDNRALGGFDVLYHYPALAHVDSDCVPTPDIGESVINALDHTLNDKEFIVQAK
jgi:hypothetical protein